MPYDHASHWITFQIKFLPITQEQSTTEMVDQTDSTGCLCYKLAKFWLGRKGIFGSTEVFLDVLFVDVRYWVFRG